MWGGVRMLHFLAKTNTSISWDIITRCTIRPCLSEVATHGPSTYPVELLILVAHLLLSWHHHSVVLWLLLQLLLLYHGLLYHGVLYHGLYHGLFYHGVLYHGLYHGILYHHGILQRHSISHVFLLVPTQLFLNLPACTNIYACYT